MQVFDSSGRELRRADHDDDGCSVPGEVLAQASLIGAIRLLEDIARRDDNSHYRRAARIQADGLKAIFKRMRAGGDPITEAEILGPLLGEQRAKNPVLTIEMEKP
jgi:hypothetical protein